MQLKYPASTVDVNPFWATIVEVIVLEGESCARASGGTVNEYGVCAGAKNIKFNIAVEVLKFASWSNEWVWALQKSFQ
jgi:hypothetical protein